MWLVAVTGLAFLAGLAGGLGMALLAAGLVALVWIGLVSLFRRQVVPSPHVSNKALAGVAAATLVGGGVMIGATSSSTPSSETETRTVAIANLVEAADTPSTATESSSPTAPPSPTKTATPSPSSKPTPSESPDPTPEPTRESVTPDPVTPDPVTPDPTPEPTTQLEAAPLEQQPAESAEPTEQLDPDFGTCKEAIANGYGPYVEGQDPEYAWYHDADHDGIVCER